MPFAPPDPDAPFRVKLRRWSASGTMTPAIIGFLSIGITLGLYEHTRGNIHRFKETVGIQRDTYQGPPGPGGQSPIRLQRHATDHPSSPEFTSATLLPGRGLNLWQLTAYLPGHGEVPLLVSPKTDPLATLTGDGADANGSSSTEYGAAFLAPWAATMSGFPSPAAGVLQTQWQGQRLSFPASGPGSTLSLEGLLLNRGADEIKTASIPDGQSALATFHAGTFTGRWSGNSEISIMVELTGQALDLTMTAQNTGSAPEPFGAGWHPFFAIPSGERSNATLVIPSSQRTQPPDRRTGLSDGTIIPTQNTPYDFVKAGGTPLHNISLDENYINLHSAISADGPIAELRDPASNYGLRIIALSSNIKTFRVIAPADRPWVSIGPNMNLPDPFGSEWDHLDTTGFVILQPGDTIQWKVRVEIFSLSHSFSGLEK